MFHPPDQKQGAIADACLPACLLTLSPPPPCPLLLSLRKKKTGREEGKEEEKRNIDPLCRSLQKNGITGWGEDKYEIWEIGMLWVFIS